MKLGSLEGIAGGDILSGMMDNLAYRVDSVVNMVTLEGGFHNLSGPLDRRMELVKRRRKLFGLPMPMLEGGIPLHGGGNGSAPSTVDIQKKQSLLKRGGKESVIGRKLREERQRKQEQKRQGSSQEQKRQGREPATISLYDKYHLR